MHYLRTRLSCHLLSRSKVGEWANTITCKRYDTFSSHHLLKSSVIFVILSDGLWMPANPHGSTSLLCTELQVVKKKENTRWVWFPWSDYVAHLEFTPKKTVQVSPRSRSAGAWDITTTVILLWNKRLVGPACTEKSIDMGSLVTAVTCHDSRDDIFTVKTRFKLVSSGHFLICLMRCQVITWGNL